MAKWLKDPLVISLTLLAALAGGLVWLKFKPKDKGHEPYLGSQINNIDKIEINYQQEKTVLKKNNNQWLIKTKENKPADEQLVTDLLNKLKVLKPKELVSQNPDNHEKYGVKGTMAAELQVFQNGQKKFELLVGKAGPSFNSHYIRQPNKNEVFLSNTTLKSALIPTDTWAESR